MGVRRDGRGVEGRSLQGGEQFAEGGMCRQLFDRDAYFARLYERKLVEPLPYISCATAADQHPFAARSVGKAHEEVVHKAWKYLRLALLDGKLLLDTSTVRQAVQCDGALRAIRAARRATECTELDDRLVVATWMGGVQEGFGKRPVESCPLGGVDGICGTEEATEDTEDIAIHGRVG